LPVLNQLGEQYAEQGVTVLALNVDGSEAGYQKFIQSNDYTHLQWARDGSGAIREAYRVRGLPTTYVIDGEGVVRNAFVGYGDEIQEALTTEVESLLE
jgi:peroxiredoxin